MANRDLAHLALKAWPFDPPDGTRIVDLGGLRLGRSTYQGVAQRNCPCRLDGLGVLSSAKRVPSSGTIHLGLHAISYPSGAGTPQRDPAELTRTAAWRSTTAGVRVTAAGSGAGYDIPMTAVAGDVGPYEAESPAVVSLAGHPLGSPCRRR